MVQSVFGWLHLNRASTAAHVVGSGVGPDRLSMFGSNQYIDPERVMLAIQQILAG